MESTPESLATIPNQVNPVGVLGTRHLATAQFHNCEALWTHDARLATASHGLAVNVLAPTG
jgi:hypothetical protein